jgi:hypothetical protein
MLEVDQPIVTDDPDLLLRYEHGVFEVTSPGGESTRVIGPLEGPRTDVKRVIKANSMGNGGWWRVRKIAHA